MDKKDTASKIKMASIDDLFHTNESREEEKREKLSEIPLSQIQNFPKHPYQVRDDEDMELLVESIRERGLILPVLVRPLENGKYEMISGHRRKRAFEHLSIDKIPARVQELTRDEAILSMVDSNLQREKILPSEKGFAYKMRLETMNRQGKRNDLTSTPLVSKLRTNEQLGQEIGESREQVRRYIRLTYLIKPILDLVDEGKIGMRPACELSYLSEEQQEMLFDAIEYNDATPSHYQAIRMRKKANEGGLTKDVINTIMEECKPNQKEKSPFRDDTITKFIPKSVPKEKQTDYVIKAIEFYNMYRERAKNGRDR